MIRVGFLAASVCMSLVLGGCRNKAGQEVSNNNLMNEVVQMGDGDILLAMEDAYLFNDENNPDRNTAEWTFQVKSEGRYEVWLSSLTKDTMNLEYNMPVIVNFGDKRLEIQPIGDEILNDIGVMSPYFRADSRAGSIYINDAGQYNLQVISEKVLPGSMLKNSSSAGINTILDHIRLKYLSN